MSVIGLVFVTIASIVGWWLVRQGILDAPWLEEGTVAVASGSRRTAPTAGKVGLGVFLAVASCLFALLTAAFFMRMASPDWQAPPAPRILWLNTALLIASSISLQLAQMAASRDQMERARAALIAGGGFAIAFLFGQLWAWRELAALGFYAANNPADAFFYLLTGVHALHLAGGLVALGRVAGKAATDPDTPEFRANLDLCAIYWHFLLFVWFLMFAMLTGWANDFGVICRRLLA
jgi:cytochrome c oxidase subunit 3